MTVLLQISPDSDSEKKLENWSIFDEVIRRTKKSAKFMGHPVENDIMNKIFAAVFLCCRLQDAATDVPGRL